MHFFNQFIAKKEGFFDIFRNFQINWFIFLKELEISYVIEAKSIFFEFSRKKLEKLSTKFKSRRKQPSSKIFLKRMRIFSLIVGFRFLPHWSLLPLSPRKCFDGTFCFVILIERECQKVQVLDFERSQTDFSPNLPAGFHSSMPDATAF